MRRTLLALLLSAGLLPAQSMLIVPTNQPTIQAGIDAVSDGFTVLVLPGLYREHIDFNGKRISVVGAGGAQATVIDGGLTKPAVTFKSKEGRGSLLAGFTIRRGLGLPNSNAAGAGIRIVAASPTIRACWIVDNICGFSGGGIGSSDQDPNYPPTSVGPASPLIEECFIARNIAGTPAGAADASGGGLAFVGFNSVALGGRPEVRGCVIVDNEANGAGGGLFARYNHAVLVENCLIARNRTLGKGATAGGGGVGLAMNAVGLLRNNRIYRNSSASDGGGVKFVNVTGPELVNETIAGNLGGGLAGHAYKDDFGQNVQAGLVNCILWGNGAAEVALTGLDRNSKPPAATITHSVVQGGYTGAGNLAADPLLLNVGSGNHRLASGSPCIDKGDGSAKNLPAVDFEGQPRIFGIAVDIGADEFDPRVPLHHADRAVLSLAQGGSIRYSLACGAPLGGSLFILFPGLDGTRPGANLGPVNLPLNPTGPTWILLSAYSSVCIGFLDGSGNAASSLVLPPALPPELKGAVLSTAGLLLAPSSFAIQGATNDENVEFTP